MPGVVWHSGFTVVLSYTLAYARSRRRLGIHSSDTLYDVLYRVIGGAASVLHVFTYAMELWQVGVWNSKSLGSNLLSPVDTLRVNLHYCPSMGDQRRGTGGITGRFARWICNVPSPS